MAIGLPHYSRSERFYAGLYRSNHFRFQRTDPGDQILATALSRAGNADRVNLFHHDVNIVSFGRPVNEQRQLTCEEYRPDGSTALYDAIGQTVLKIKDSLGETSGREDDISVIVVILTDGHENASKLFNLKGIRNLVKELEAGGKWTFTYLGATLDAREIAEAMNIKRENSMAFAKTEMKQTYSKLSKSLGNFFENKKHNTQIILLILLIARLTTLGQSKNSSSVSSQLVSGQLFSDSANFALTDSLPVTKFANRYVKKMSNYFSLKPVLETMLKLSWLILIT